MDKKLYFSACNRLNRAPAKFVYLKMESDDQEAASFEKAKQEFKEKIDKSKLSAADKKKWIDGMMADPNFHTAEDVKKLSEYLPTSEKALEDSNKEFSSVIKKMTTKGVDGLTRLAPKSVKEYKDWHDSLSLGDPLRYKGKDNEDKRKKNDLDNPRREQLCQIFSGKEALDGERLPRAIREKFTDKFNNSDLQEREKLVAELIKKHTELKGQFLGLPVKMQEKYREKFRESDISGREQMLTKIKAEVAKEDAKNPKKPETAKQLSQKEAAESANLQQAFSAKMVRMVRQNLFSPGSIKAYEGWFAGLSLAEQKKSLVHSDVDNPDRELVKDAFYALSKAKNPEKDPEHDAAFRNADLDKRIAMTAALDPNWRTVGAAAKGAGSKEKPAAGANAEKKKGLLQKLLHKIIGSAHDNKIEERMQSYAIGQHTAILLERYQRRENDKSNTKEKAEKKGLGKTLERTQFLEQAASMSEHTTVHGHVNQNQTVAKEAAHQPVAHNDNAIPAAENDNATPDHLVAHNDNSKPTVESKSAVKIQFNHLEHHRDARHNMLKGLKRINVDDQNAEIAGVSFRREDGQEIKEAEVYQKTELLKEEKKLDDALAPVLQMEARQAGIIANKQEMDAAIKSIDLKDIGKKIIRNTQ